MILEKKTPGRIILPGVDLRRYALSAGRG